MSFSEKTLEIIKNFASINQGVVFKKGTKLRTCSVMKNIYASAELPDEIPVDFAIYDLNEFLSTLSLFVNPTIEYKDNHLHISSEKSKIKYYFASPAVVVSPPEKDPQFTDVMLSFVLTDETWRCVQKAAAVLKLTRLNLETGKLRATGDKENKNVYDVEVDTTGSINSPVFVNIENIKLLPGDYKVEVFERALRFENTEDSSLVYFVAVEAED